MKIALSKEVCKHCRSIRNVHVESISGENFVNLSMPWNASYAFMTENDDELWKRGLVHCPTDNLELTKNIPDECPYSLEHEVLRNENSIK